MPEEAETMDHESKANVLVVDDEPVVRDLLVDALSGPDIEIITASSGKEAVELAAGRNVDLVVADLYLGDCTGLEVIDRLRDSDVDLPAVVITGNPNIRNLTEASRSRPVELMTKPLDIDRLLSTIRTELARRADRRKRSARFRRAYRKADRRRRDTQEHLDTTCADLTGAYRNLSSQLAMQKVVLGFQNDLLSAKTDDDVFCSLFRMFVRRSGGLYGAALVCDSNAQLNIIGRFGVPYPDSVDFCRALSDPLVDAVLATPEVMLFDAGRSIDMFDESIHRYLPGLSILLIPLIPGPGELIGMIMLYRKGEQPFGDHDVAIAEMIAAPTAIAVRRND